MSLDTDLCTYLTAQSGVHTEQNKISENASQPRVWFQRRQSNTDVFNNGNVWGTIAVYDIEVAGIDPDATGTIADTLKTALNGYRGAMGNSTILGGFVEDANDEYIPKLLDVDEGFNVFAFEVVFYV